MTVCNFEFVRSEQPALAQLLGDAERLLDDDSSCFLLKVRLALELWCHDFADLHGIRLALETTLAEKLEVLSMQKVFPADLLQQLLQLRQLANQALHIRQDERGRHLTLPPLPHAQQVAILKCLFELVCYTKYYLKPGTSLPLWQTYPKQNIRLLLAAAAGLAGTDPAASITACVQLCRGLLAAQPAKTTHAATQASQPADWASVAGSDSVAGMDSGDLQYWLQRGLRLGLQHANLEALHLLAELAFSKTLPAIDIGMLDNWLKQYQRRHPSAALDHYTAQLLERQNQLEKALKAYDRAAQAGHHAAIKRLLEYWGSRCPQQLQHYLSIGLVHHEPQALLTSMALLLTDASKTAVDAVPASLQKTLKSYLVQARATGMAGLGYIEGMCHHLGILGYALCNQTAAQLVLAHYQKVPAYCKAALNAFYVLLAAEQYADAMRLAPKALALAADSNTPLLLAELEFDIALALLKLHELKQPVPFSKTPQQLLQSAARRGYNRASLFLNSSSRSTLRSVGRRKPTAMPGWATKLAARGARVSGGITANACS